MRVAAVEAGRFPVVTALQRFAINSEADIVGALKQFVARAGLKGAPAVFSVPSELANLHWTKLPTGRNQELVSLAQFKLREQLSRSSDESSLGVVPFEVSPDGQLESLVIAVPREVVAPRAELLQKADLDPIAAEIEAQSLIRIAQAELTRMNALFRQMSMTIVDLGAERTRFIVVQDRRIQFVRTVKFGSNRLVSVVAEALGVPTETAQALLDQRTTRLDESMILHLEHATGPVSVDVSAAMDSLFRELRRLITYFRTLRADRSYRGLMERLLLSGELVATSGFADRIGKVIGIRTHSLEPLTEMRLALEPTDLNQVATTPQRYTIALGLALSQYGQTQTEQSYERSANQSRHIAA